MGNKFTKRILILAIRRLLSFVQVCLERFADLLSLLTNLSTVPQGNFAAQGSQPIPSEYKSSVPSIAFTIPDLEGEAKLELKAKDGGQDLACIQSNVDNGKTADVPAVSYVAAGIAGAALLLTAFSAMGSTGGGGHTPSPNFGEVFAWFQSISINGMMSVNYPPVYQSFSKNFAFSTGLIPWNSMQTKIDNFRQSTGGNLTTDSVQYLRNATLVHSDGSKSDTSGLTKRELQMFPGFALLPRDVTTSVNGTGSSNSTSNGDHNSKVTHYVHGIQAYVEQLTIPQANTFMTVLLIFAIVIAAIAVGILLLKVILEFWALFASFPKKLTGFRKRYWGLLARTITNLILLLYGVWTMYCIFQFTNGDSWAAKLLAGLTLGIFTAVLAFFTFRIWQLARRYKKSEGDTAALFENKETWRKYSLFYDNYNRGYWWLFMPTIVYLFARGCVIAAANDHGLSQTAGHLILESLMLILLLWARPFATKSSNWINAIIQTVRVLSVICILVFVEELGIAQSTKTVTGVVLIAVQSVLTLVLGILIAVNSIIVCVRENPHRKRRKEAGMSFTNANRSLAFLFTDNSVEKLNRDLDNLTPLDARNSLLMDPVDYKDVKDAKGFPLTSYANRSSVDVLRPYRDEFSPPASRGRPGYKREESTDHLVSSAASMGHYRSVSRESFQSSTPPAPARQPTVPDVYSYPGRAY